MTQPPTRGLRLRDQNRRADDANDSATSTAYKAERNRETSLPAPSREWERRAPYRSVADQQADAVTGTMRPRRCRGQPKYADQDAAHRDERREVVDRQREERIR